MGANLNNALRGNTIKRLLILLLLIGIAGCGPDAEIEEQAKREFDRRQEQENEWKQEVADRLVAVLTAARKNCFAD